MPTLGQPKGDNSEIEYLCHHLRAASLKLLHQLQALYTSSCTLLAGVKGGGGICGGATTAITLALLLLGLILVATMGFCLSTRRARRDYADTYPAYGGGGKYAQSPQAYQTLPAYTGPSYSYQQTGHAMPSVVNPNNGHGQYYTYRHQQPLGVQFGQVQVRKY